MWEKKKKKREICDKSTVTCDVGIAQCEDGTAKCEKKKWYYRMWQKWGQM